jgi:hypothetical protein
MANFSLNKSKDFKRLQIKADVDVTATHTVVEVYVNSVLTYTFAVGGTQTISGVVYTTTAGLPNLSWTSTVTTFGTEYIFELNTDTFGLTSGTLDPIADGVYTIKILKLDGTEIVNLGDLMFYGALCCIAGKLSKYYAGQCSCTEQEVLDKVKELYALTYAAETAAGLIEIDNAICMFKIVNVECSGSDCGCH